MRLLRIAAGALVLAVPMSCKKGGTEPVTSTVISVSITPSSGSVKPGQTLQLRATVAGPPGIPNTVTWRSQDPQFATVSGTGLVTGVSEGGASIRAAWTEDPEEFAIAVVLVTSTPITDGQPALPVRVVPARRK